MPYEIEFMPVGETSRAGDSILIRHGNPAAPSIMVIDGGNQTSGQAMVEHLRQLTGLTTPVVDDLLVTHPDADHAAGAVEVYNGTIVRRVHAHVPWEHAAAVKDLCRDKRRTVQGIADQLRVECRFVDDLVSKAEAHCVPVIEPFQGARVGPFTVLSPSRTDYVQRLAEMLEIDPVQAAAERITEMLAKAAGGVLALASRVAESWGFETLRDGGATNARNEMSTVLYGDFAEEGRVLLTGDAGIRGLTAAANYAEWLGWPLRDFRMVQVPHHGSRRNVGPTILNRIIGEKVAPGSQPHFYGIISAPKDDEKHPRKVVVNAFHRRGASVTATQGKSLVFQSGFGLRPGYGPAAPLPFYSTVEEYD